MLRMLFSEESAAPSTFLHTLGEMNADLVHDSLIRSQFVIVVSLVIVKPDDAGVSAMSPTNVDCSESDFA